MQLAEYGFIRLSRGSLEYRWLAPRQAELPTLVLLHEGLGCVALWKAFPDRLAEVTGCGVFIYSRYGYGQSDSVDIPRPLTYMHEEGLDVLPELLAELGFESIVLIGHSDGASISLIHAGGRPAESICGLVLMAPHVFNEPVCVASIEAAAKAYRQQDLKQRLERYHGDNVDIAFQGWSQAWLDPGFLHWNLERYLPTIRVPMLVIQGRQDQYGTEKQVIAIRDRVKSPLRVEMLDTCGHSPHQDQPQATLQSTQAFIAGLKLSESNGMGHGTAPSPSI